MKNNEEFQYALESFLLHKILLFRKLTTGGSYKAQSTLIWNISFIERRRVVLYILLHCFLFYKATLHKKYIS